MVMAARVAAFAGVPQAAATRAQVQNLRMAPSRSSPVDGGFRIEYAVRGPPIPERSRGANVRVWSGLHRAQTLLGAPQLLEALFERGQALPLALHHVGARL